MKSGNDSNRRLRFNVVMLGVMAAGVAALALYAHGQPCAVNPNGRSIDRKDKVETKAPSVRQMLAAGITRSAQATVEYIDEDAPVITVYSEQSKRSGRVAAGATQTYVYRYNQLWPYGIFYNYNSTTSDLTTIQGVFLADNLTLGNGFIGGMTISGYELYVYRSSLDPQPGLADVHVELWDGDPFEVYDTGADGYSVSVIDGTQADFVDIPADTHAWLVASFDPEVVIPNERVWMVLTSNACRLGWHLSFTKPLIGSDAPDDIWEAVEDMSQGGDPEHLPGQCCEDGSYCDPDNPCPGDTGTRYFCWDDHAEHLGTWWFGGPCTGDDETDYCATFVANVFATTDVVVSLVPVSADAKPEDDPPQDGWRIEGNEIIMTEGGRPVWLEIHFSDWDPPPWTCYGGPNDGQPCNSDDDCDYWHGVCGTHMKAWGAHLDSLGYSSGQEGTLAPYAYACTSHAECPPIIGPESMCTGGFCDATFMDSSRADYVFNHPYVLSELKGIDVSTPDYRWGSTINTGDPVPPPGQNDPPRGDQYAATLVIQVPDDAKGTFTIALKEWPNGGMLDQDSQLMRLMAKIPAKITVEIGQCCYDIGYDAFQCLDGLTRPECEELPGPRVFVPGSDCSAGCPTLEDCCLPDRSCVPLLPDECLALGGQPVSECLGDGNGDGFDDACPLPTIPVVSTWGLLITFLLLAVLGKVYFGRRRGACSTPGAHD